MNDSPQQRKRAKRVAFLIGNATFPNAPDLRPLAGPPNDVRRLGELFEDPEIGGYEVHSFVDRRSTEILPALEEKLTELGRDDFVLIYYSGHGRLDRSGKLCLASVDTRTNAIVNTSIRVRSLTDLLYQSNVGNTVLLLDCCFSGAAGQDLRGSVSDELAQQTPVGHHIFTSSTDTEVSRDEVDDSLGEKLGAFTARLIHGLKSGEADTDADGAIGLQELRNYVQNSLQRQKPQYWGKATFRDPLIALNHGQSDHLRVARIADKLRTWVSESMLDPVTYAQMLKALHQPETDPERRGKEILLRLEQSSSFTAAIVQLTWAGFTATPATPSPRPAPSPKRPDPAPTPDKVLKTSPAEPESPRLAEVRPTPQREPVVEPPRRSGDSDRTGGGDPPKKPVAHVPSPEESFRRLATRYWRPAGATVAILIVGLVVFNTPGEPPPVPVAPVDSAQGTVLPQGDSIALSATRAPTDSVGKEPPPASPAETRPVETPKVRVVRTESPVRLASRPAVTPTPPAVDAKQVLADAMQRVEDRDHRGAVRQFREYLRLRPSDHEARYYLARSLQVVEDEPAAEREYRESIRLKPNYGYSYAGLGAMLVHQGRTNEAMGILNDARRLDPTSSGPYTHLAIGYVNTKQVAEAEQYFRMALRLNSGDTEAQSHFAQLLYDKGAQQARTGNVLSAIASLEEAVSLRAPTSAQRQMVAGAYARHGASLEQASDFRGARTFYEKALAVEPYNELAYSGLLGILHDVEFDFQGALVHAMKWMEKFPKDTSRLTEVIEAFVTAGGGASSGAIGIFDRFREWELAPERRVVVNALELVALAARGDDRRLWQRRNELRELVRGMPANVNYSWRFTGTQRYVAGLRTHRDWLSRMLTAIQNNDRERILDALR
jgi:Flp pilus assembly protein TadD